MLKVNGKQALEALNTVKTYCSQHESFDDCEKDCIFFRYYGCSRGYECILGQIFLDESNNITEEPITMKQLEEE